jgi:predicted  nucleic acid-binding Zn-ribbon protein
LVLKLGQFDNQKQRISARIAAMPLIENLLALYSVDKQVRGLTSRVESAKIYLNVQERQLKEIELEKAENSQQRKQHQAHIATIETETGSIDDRVSRLREDLNKAVNEKQYSAVLAEINTLKEQRKAFEDEELTEMASVETLEESAKDIQARLEERQTVLTSAAAELKTRETEIAEQLAELEVQREAAASIIPDDALSTFDSIADDYEGESMAAIDVEDLKRREYSCSSCSLRISLDALTTLLGSSENIVACGSCDRILYLKEDTRQAICLAK